MDTYDTKLTFVFTPSRHLPVMDLADDVPQVGVADRMVYNLNVIREDAQAQHTFDEANYNLTKPQQEDKLWHCRLAHAGVTWIQDLMRGRKDNVGNVGTPTFIPTKHPSSASCTAPKCSACIFAKQHRRTPGSQVTSNHLTFNSKISITPLRRELTTKYVLYSVSTEASPSKPSPVVFVEC